MQYKKFVKILANHYGVGEKETDKRIKSLFEVIENQVKKGESIGIKGFGKFYRAPRKERRARNPQTGDAMTIQAREVNTFKASKNYRDA